METVVNGVENFAVNRLGNPAGYRLDNGVANAVENRLEHHGEVARRAGCRTESRTD